ncbi:MAG: ABC transporter permease [Ruminococcus sp.]|jgi:ABC-2 type transport system permease protein|nr:ABC transporter permease [Ruminococcus sp.]
MTSTVSFKEKLKQAYSVFKWDLKSCSGTMAVYAILAAVFTTIILTLCLVVGFYAQSNTMYDTYTYSQSLYSLAEAPDTNAVAEAVKVFQIIASQMIYFLTIIFAIIYTVKVYSYLHNKRKADLYGSLPISRIMLFVSKSASAYLFTLIPAMFFLGIIFLISACFGQPIVNEAIDIYVKLLMGTLASISAYGLISVCCGTTINSVIMFIAVCIAYPLSAMFIKGVANGFFCGTYTGIFKDHFIMNALNPLAAYDGINIIYWLIFSVVCIVASAFLVKRRKAERAQASFAYYLPCHIVKVLVAFLVGMFLGVLFGSLNVFGDGYLGFVFGFILGSVPAFVITHLIFYKGFSKLIRTSIPLGGLVVVVVAVMAVCNYDVFGYNEFVPNFDDVQSAGLIDAEHFYRESDSDLNKIVRNSAEDFTDKESINSIISSHSSIIADKDFSSDKKFQSVWYDMFVDNMNIGLDEMQYSFAYKMNNGRVVTRTYSLSVYDTFSDNYIDTTNIVKTKTYTEKYSAAINAKQSDISSVIVKKTSYAGCASENTDKSKEDFAKVLEAFREEFKADKNNTETVLAPLGGGYYYEVDIEDFKTAYPDAVCLLQVNTGSNDYYSNVGNIFTALFTGNYSIYDEPRQEVYIIPKSYTKTITALKEIGVLNSDNTINDDSDYFKALNQYY